MFWLKKLIDSSKLIDNFFTYYINTFVICLMYLSRLLWLRVEPGSGSIETFVWNMAVQSWSDILKSSKKTALIHDGKCKK